MDFEGSASEMTSSTEKESDDEFASLRCKTTCSTACVILAFRDNIDLEGHADSPSLLLAQLTLTLRALFWLCIGRPSYTAQYYHFDVVLTRDRRLPGPHEGRLLEDVTEFKVGTSHDPCQSASTSSGGLNQCNIPRPVLDDVVCNEDPPPWHRLLREQRGRSRARALHLASDAADSPHGWVKDKPRYRSE